MSEQETAIRIGEALAALRRERGLSQAEAGARIGMTSQGWSLYEAGRRAGLFRPDMQRRLTSALDATPEDLLLMMGEAAPPSPVMPITTGVEGRGRTFEGATPVANRQTMWLQTEEMAPWAVSGTRVEYDLTRPPVAGRGCVVHLAGGQVMARLFVSRSSGGVQLSDASGKLETLKAADIVALGAVTARFDPD